MDYDYSTYVTVILKLFENRIINEQLVIGENISPLPGVKMVFDGYGFNADGTENPAFETYALFIHKDSAKRGFVFPEHETEEVPYGELFIQRPDQEVCIEVNHNAETDRWNIHTLEEALVGESYMTTEIVMDVLTKIYDKHYA